MSSLVIPYSPLTVGTFRHAEPTARLRFVNGRLQQEWLIVSWVDGRPVGSEREWREVESVAPDNPAEAGK
jgi:hypothetical protein